MAKTKRELITATFIISCAATVLSIVCMATEKWVSADLKPNKIGLEKAEVNYGLFGGTYIPYSPLSGQSNKEYKLAIACIFEENVCGFSISDSGDKRRQDLENIINGNACSKTLAVSKELLQDETIFDYNNVDIELFDNAVDGRDKMRYSLNKNDDSTVESTVSSSTLSDVDVETHCDKTFLNGGLWLSSIFFLSLSIMMGAFTSTISVMNTAGNPISPWLNIWGLYIWNSLAISFLILTLILYGSQFAAIITTNVSVVDTLNGNYSNESVSLGYSYWLMLAPMLLHFINIGLFYYRQHLIEQEPEITEDKIDAANRDGMIFVY